MEIEHIQILKDNKNENSLIQEILSESLSENQNQIYLRLHPLISHNSNISILTDHLILTSAANVIPHVIDALGVTCVISAAPELPDIPLHEDIAYQKFHVMDTPNSNILLCFDDAADLIAQAASLGGRTLVFCVAGVSRSASLCIAYLMKHHQLTLREAYDYVKGRRPKIRPNCGFFKQLIEYEKKMFVQSSVQMVFNEFVQMNIPDVYDDEYKVVRSIERKLKGRYKR